MLLGYGLVNLDDIVVVNTLVHDGKAPAETTLRQVGGPVPVALQAYTRLGGTTCFTGIIGDDSYGDYISERLSQSITVPALNVCPNGISSRSIVIIERTTGARTIVNIPATGTCENSLQSLKERLSPQTILHLDGRDLPANLELAAAAKQRGAPVSWDLGTMRPGREELFPLIDIVIASKGGGAGAFPDCAGDPMGQVRGFLERGARIAAVTLAENGVVVGERGSEPLHLPAIPTDPIRDTCGAGDTFHGAFLHATLHGADAVEAARYAQAAASLRIGRIGHRDGLPTNAEVNRLLSAPNA